MSDIFVVVFRFCCSELCLCAYEEVMFSVVCVVVCCFGSTLATNNVAIVLPGNHYIIKSSYCKYIIRQLNQ